MAKIDHYAKQNAAAISPASLACSSQSNDESEDSKDDDVVIVEDMSTPSASANTDYCLSSFDVSGLPNHLRGSWNNAKKFWSSMGSESFLVRILKGP